MALPSTFQRKKQQSPPTEQYGLASLIMRGKEKIYPPVAPSRHRVTSPKRWRSAPVGAPSTSYGRGCGASRHENVDSRNGSHLEMTGCSHRELHLGAVRSNMKAVHLAVLLQSSELLSSGARTRQTEDESQMESAAVQHISKRDFDINLR